MTKSGTTKSWAEQLADLEDPAPRDFDPEDVVEHENDDTESEIEDENSARAHYVDMAKSKLRKQNDTQRDLGARYAGSSISRELLLDNSDEDDAFGGKNGMEESDDEQYADPDEDIEGMEIDGDDEIDSDEAFESGDEGKFGGYKFRGSKMSRPLQKGVGRDEVSEEEGVGNSPVEDFDGLDSDADDNDGGDSTHLEQNSSMNSEDSDSTDISMSDESTEPQQDDRAALRKIMAEDQTTVTATLSKAAKADIEKGRAIKQQRTTFDTLLNTRIKLQKALIATNSLSASPTITGDGIKTVQAAETAALQLWNSITTLRSSFQPQAPKPSPTTPSTPSTTLWQTMQTLESTSLPTRRSTLTKWSHKTNPTATLPRANKFSQTPTQTPLTTVLDQHLTSTSLTKHISKTRTPRSCAPLQAAARTPHDPSIYDDADFYTLLLRELVDQRVADSTLPSAPGNVVVPKLPSQRDFKVRKQVDTKASKGRKMRYTVQEKLQNFMAPDDRGSWGERQRGELFGSLLGRRVELGEGEGEGDGDGGSEGEGEDPDGREVKGLKLFG